MNSDPRLTFASKPVLELFVMTNRISLRQLPRTRLLAIIEVTRAR